MDELVTKEKNELGLTTRQENFLSAYEKVLDVYKAAKMSGIAKTNIMADLRRDTPFANQFRAISQRVEEDPRFTKTGIIGNLIKLRKDINASEMEDKDKFKMLLDINKEINRMIEGNIAATKKVVDKREIKVEAVYDFTKKLPDAQTIDTDYAEVTG